MHNKFVIGGVSTETRTCKAGSYTAATVSGDLQRFPKVFPKFDTLYDRFIIVAKRAQRGQNPRPYRTYWGKSPLRGSGVLGVHCLSLK